MDRIKDKFMRGTAKSDISETKQNRLDEDIKGNREYIGKIML